MYTEFVSKVVYECLKKHLVCYRAFRMSVTGFDLYSFLYNKTPCYFHMAFYVSVQNPKHTMSLPVGNNFVSLRVIFSVFTENIFFISVSFVMISHVIFILENVFRCVRIIPKNYYWFRHVSVHLSVCKLTRLHLKGFSGNLIFEYFSLNCPENSSSIKV